MSTDKAPLLSVIVPVYNTKPYLARCLESILSQTHTNLEVIVIDDGSTDGSGELCDDFSKKDMRVRVIHKDNGGVSAARNAGIDAACGDWIAFVDSDDWIEPDMYEKLMLAAIDSETRIAGCGYMEYHSDGGMEKKTFPELAGVDSCEDILEYYLCENDFFRVWSVLYSRSLLESGTDAGGIRFRPDMSQFEDTLFVVDVLLRAESIIYIPEAPYHYCWRADSLVNASFSPRWFLRARAWEHIAESVSAFSTGLMWFARMHAMEIAVDLLVISVRGKYYEGLPELKKAARRYMAHYLFCSGRSFIQKFRHVLYAYLPRTVNRIYRAIFSDA